MIFPSFITLTALAASTTLTTALPLPRLSLEARASKPAAFYLAGDSTTAAQSAAGGGWGVGFLKTLKNGSIGTDLGYNGATTVSFVAGGAWANVIDAVNRTKVAYDPYVTIQFGHNDQKPSANISISQYEANLRSLAQQVISAGGTPILVTPISRRDFNSSGLVIENLSDQRAATISVAKSLGINYIDLNAASTTYLNAIGATNAATYNRIPTDYTHLNANGSVLFGNMVSWLIGTTTTVGSLVNSYTVPDTNIVRAIKAGKYIFPQS